ncbi:MAG: cell division protein FtsZ, partial [Anaerolineae bacterium]|nr:cell division protein FtsZ [Anaerolineae bacterium]
IQETAHPDVNIIFGAVIDPEMEDQIQITVIATGFNVTDQRKPIVAKRAIEFPVRTFDREDIDIPAFLRR